MSILIFNEHSSYLTIEICNALAAAYPDAELILFAGVVNQREQELDNRVRVKKTIRYNKRNIVTRLFSWLVAFTHFTATAMIFHRKSKLLLVSNPPLISFLAYFLKNRYDILIFDIYPDALAGSGFISNKSVVYKVWKKANIHFYRKSERIFTISKGMKNSLSKYADTEKIRVVNLWSSFSPAFIKKENIPFLADYDLTVMFVVMYSGNMGKGSGLDVIIQVAERLKDIKDIVFLFAGDGWMADTMKQQAKSKGLSNCIFMPYQPADKLVYSLSAADISVVTLPAGADSISIPNKTYTLIALCKPILAITPVGSDLHGLINKYSIGECFEYAEAAKITDFILKLKTEPGKLKHFSDNCMQCSNEFTNANASFFV